MYPTPASTGSRESPVSQPTPPIVQQSPQPASQQAFPPTTFQQASPQTGADAFNDVSTDEAQRASFTLEDMALFHHWTLSTSRTFVNSPDADNLWQTVFPEIAYQHSYVMHGILSIAALHITHLRPTDRHVHLRKATHHHMQALSGFREDIQFIGPHNANALFVNSTLLFLYAFLTFGKTYDEAAGEDVMRTSRILGADWIPLVRGIQAVLSPVYEQIKGGPLCSTLKFHRWDETDPDEQPSPDDAQMLRIREMWQGDSNATIYNETLESLRRVSAWVWNFHNASAEDQSLWGYNREWSAPFMWLAIVPKEYFVLQRQRQPLALLIFAYFGAFLQRLDKQWWTENCGKSIVRVIDDILGPYWNEWMEWPLHVVGLR